VPTGGRSELATSLQLPWSVVPLENGSALVSERDTALVIELTADGNAREVGEVPGVVPGGEGGLLGLAVLTDGDGSGGGSARTDDWLYAYTTTEGDNRVIRMPLTGEPGAMALGEPETVVDGIAKARTHNGGRLAFGPDGMLYVTTGDAGVPERSQDAASLSGKILRLTPEGDVPEDNPTPGSPVWSLGHRNPQGIAWTEDGAMYAAEFGQNTWDELNLIEPGSNYGWPEVEGIGEDDRFVDPLIQWTTDESSPSGIAAVGSTLFVAGLGGERLWMVQDAADAADDTVVVDDLGRIRDAVAAPDGTLWILTNNTGRSPRDGDDRLVSLQLGAAG
jgi:glucose/arabinose dehydrogenase